MLNPSKALIVSNRNLSVGNASSCLCWMGDKLQHHRVIECEAPAHMAAAPLASIQSEALLSSLTRG